MSSAQQTPPRLRPSAPTKACRGPADRAAATALHPDWSRILRDITCCGVVRLQVGNDCARLSSMAEPWSAAVHGPACRRRPGPGDRRSDRSLGAGGISQGHAPSATPTWISVTRPRSTGTAYLVERGTATGRTSARAWSGNGRRVARPRTRQPGRLQRDLDQLQRHELWPCRGTARVAGMTRRATTATATPVDPRCLPHCSRH